MTIKKFNYLKEGAKEPKIYEVLILNRDEDHENGISLVNLNEEEKTTLFQIVREFEEKLKPYMKNFRNFKKSNMQTIIE